MNRLGSLTKFNNVTHVIFDMDGLLLDTERLYTDATQNIVSRYGKVYTWDMKCELMGMTGHESARRIVELLDLPLTWREYYQLAEEQYELLMPDACLKPDSEHVYKRTIERIAAAYGKRYTADVRLKILGVPAVDCSKIAVKEMQLPISSEEFFKRFIGEAYKHLRNCPLMPGAEELIKHLHSHKIPIAIATSSNDQSFKIKTAKHPEFIKHFHHIVKGGSDPDVKKGKPAPDIFLACASRFDNTPSPKECLVFEDAPNGVRAAITAGMQCVMVPDAQIDEKDCKEATVVVPNLLATKLELFGLPPLKL